MTDTVAASLSKIPLFSSVDEGSLDALPGRVVRKTFRKNSIIVTEGDVSDSLYIVCSGKLKVYVGDDQGKEAILAMLTEGDYFGELAFLLEAPRSASVACVEDSTLLIISRAVFEQFLAQHSEVSIALMRGLVDRVYALTSNVKSLALMDVYGRVAKLLLDVASEEDGRLITGKMTQQDIAERVGSSREMVSRILKELKTGGYIDQDGRCIIINKHLPARW